MSEDRDPDEGQTGLAARPQRPTGKRSRRPGGGTALAEMDLGEEALTEEFDAVDESAAKDRKATAGKGASRNPFVFVWTYLKQVVAEMRKVIWPNRKQMASYTAVVLVFIIFMTALIFAADLGLAKLVLWVFG